MCAFRDPHGIRPLVYGSILNDDGRAWSISSESGALSTLGFEAISDVAPGEAIFIDNGGNMYQRQCAEKTKLSPCIFEYVYFARPDSIIDGMSVYKSRLRMGEHLAQQIIQKGLHHDVDVVIPIPDTSRTSAIQVAHHLGVKYREGFIKNRYIGRTFIMPGQEKRKKSVKKKLNPIDLEINDKNVQIIPRDSGSNDKKKLINYKQKNKYIFFDKIFLKVLKNHSELMPDIFLNLFQSNSDSVIKFLSNKSNFIDDIKVILNTKHKIKFLNSLTL